LQVVPLALLWVAAQSALYGYIHVNGLGQFIANHLPVGSVFFLVFLVLIINPILSRFGREAAFTAEELTLVWAMATAAASVPGYGLMEFIFPYIAAPLYYATPENQWTELIFPHLPKWLYLNDLRAAQDFWEGIGPHDPIPWGAWTKPAAFAIAFGLAFFFSAFCWAAILRRQWVERVRYAFPLVQLPYHLTEPDPMGGWFRPIFRRPLFWIALGAAALIHLLRGLHRFYPVLPDIPLDYPIERFFPTKPWSAIVQGWPLLFRLRFSVIGVTYFLHLDVAMSIWFFFLFYKLQEVAFSAFAMTRLHTQQQVMGAVFILAVVSLWQARRHLIAVIRKTFNPAAQDVDDADEPMSYRAAALGMTAGFIALGLMLLMIGMSLWLAVLFIGLMWVLATTAAWHVSNAGCLLVNVGFTPYEFFKMLFGARTLGVQNMLLLSFDRSSIPNWSSQSLMAYSIQNFRLSDMHHFSARRIHIASWMLVAVVFAVIVTCIATLNWIYRRGALNLTFWIFNVGPSVMRRVEGEIINPSPVNVPGIMGASLGGVIMSVLIFMRQRFLWWPLHPLGYALGVTWAPSRLWFSTLIGWALKLAILRFLGFHAYRRGQPFFVGLIVGEYFMTAVWQLIGLKTGMGYWGGPPS
jgi:hypothetical protein